MDRYKDDSGIRFLEKAGVELLHLNEISETISIS